MNKINIWGSPFDFASLSDRQLRQQIDHIPAPIGQLDKMLLSEAHFELKKRMETIVLATDQMIPIIRDIAGFARSFALTRYGSERKFIENVYSAALPTISNLTICLTGHAGTGKSELLKVINRLIATDRIFQSDIHGSFPIRAIWPVVVDGYASLGGLLAGLYRPGAPSSSKISIARSEAHFHGVSLITVDEFQFQSASSASAQASKMLLQMSSIGPPLIFACNYSMLHKLARRPQEERQRLLTKVYELQPESLNSSDWERYVRALLGISKVFAELARDQSTPRIIHELTFGLKRQVVQILCLAYAQLRKRKGEGKGGVTKSDLEMAYVSIDYSSTRSTVSKLQAGHINPKLLDYDLYSPLSEAAVNGTIDNVTEHPAQADFRQREGQAHLASTMRPEERAVAAELERGNKLAQLKAARPKKPTPTVESLLRAHQKV